MSFKLFIYYCAVCGGWAAAIGWVVGRFLVPSGATVMTRALIFGTFLGMLVALGLGLLDGLWNLSSKQMVKVVFQGMIIAAIGSVGSLIGAFIGESLHQTNEMVGVILGWTLAGLLIGASFGVYEILIRTMQNKGMGSAVKKMTNGIIGGTVGGLLGSILFFVIRYGLGTILGKDPLTLLSSSFAGFIALGACIGLFIGLAQVILKEAWVRVEAGFRPGRELILTKPETTAGRAESCDIGLFGDNNVERLHLRIVQQGDQYLLVDNGTPSGTYLNEVRITQATPLRSGDMIRLGRNVLRFGERQKRTQEPRIVASGSRAPAASPAPQQTSDANPFAF